MTQPATSSSPSAGTYRGEVVYLFAFDIAYDLQRVRLESLLGQPVQEYAVGLSKRMPRTLFFHRPQMVSLPPERRTVHGRDGVEVRLSVKVFGIGALSIQARVPFEVAQPADLAAWHDLAFADRSLADHVREVAERVLDELRPYCVQPVEHLAEPEAYTVFCLHGLPSAAGASTGHAEDWLAANRRAVAAALLQEDDGEHLAEQEVAESTQRYLSYYQHDLVVTDWDAAMLIGAPGHYEDVLHIMAVANVQLVELTAYDRSLDVALEACYRDLKRSKLRLRSSVQANLREIRVDLARLSDELENITKFFGDWYLAKLYQDLSARFHLSDWHEAIGQKLETLGDLYALLQQERTNFFMLVLEVTIVALFILDVILLVAGL